MIAQRVRGLHYLVTAFQGGMVAVWFWVWYGLFILAAGSARGFFVASYITYCIVLVFGLILESITRPAIAPFAPGHGTSLLAFAGTTMRQTSFALGALFAFLVLDKNLFISRAFLLGFAPQLYLVLLGTNRWLPQALARRMFRGLREQRTLLVGRIDTARKLASWITRKAQFGIRIVGLLTDQPPAPCPVPILGRPDAFAATIRSQDVTQAILLDLPDRSRPDLDLLAAADANGVRVLILNDLEELMRRPLVAFNDDGLMFLTFHEEPLESPLNRVVKRLLDLAIAIPVTLLVLPPTMLLVAILHRLQSPGPLFFRQTRAGILNREFVIWKFRTMRHNHGDETRPAQQADERVFPAGRFLRRFSLDELPQFLNVLAGDMSVVGPRPHLPEHNRLFADIAGRYHIRTFVKPGITGLAQVRGFRGEPKTNADIEARLASDIVYFENWSIALDVAIIARTAVQVLLPPQTAY